MKLSELKAAPQLIEVTLDDEDLVKQYGEPIVFYTYDRQPLDIFMKIANADQTNTNSMINVLRTLILDEKGREIITEKETLPTHVLMRAIGKVTDILGK